jgi:hypothetical protein
MVLVWGMRRASPAWSRPTGTVYGIGEKKTYKDRLVRIGNRLAAVGGVVEERVEGPQLVNVPVDEGVHRKQPLHVQDRQGVDRSRSRRRRRSGSRGKIRRSVFFFIGGRTVRPVGRHPKGGVRLSQSKGERVQLVPDRVGLVPRGHGHKGVANELELPQLGLLVWFVALSILLLLLLQLPPPLEQQGLLVQSVFIAGLKVDRPKVRDAPLQVADRAVPAPVSVPDHQRCARVRRRARRR